jgi:hypothetical protein
MASCIHAVGCKANIDTVPGESLLSIIMWTPYVVMTIALESVYRDPRGSANGFSCLNVLAMSTGFVNWCTTGSVLGS